MTKPTTLDDIMVTITPTFPYANGDTFTFNLPEETKAAITDLIEREVIGEEMDKFDNPYSSDWRGGYNSKVLEASQALAALKQGKK